MAFLGFRTCEVWMIAGIALGFLGGWLTARSVYRSRLDDSVQRFISAVPEELKGEAAVVGLHLFSSVSSLCYGLEDFLNGRPARPCSSNFWSGAVKEWVSCQGMWGRRYAEIELPMEETLGGPSAAMLPHDRRVGMLRSVTREIDRLSRGQFRWYRKDGVRTRGSADGRDESRCDIPPAGEIR